MKIQKKRMYECPVCEFSAFNQERLEKHISEEAERERRISQGIEVEHLKHPYRPSQYY